MDRAGDTATRRYAPPLHIKGESELRPRRVIGSECAALDHAANRAGALAVCCVERAQGKTLADRLLQPRVDAWWCVHGTLTSHTTCTACQMQLQRARGRLGHVGVVCCSVPGPMNQGVAQS